MSRMQANLLLLVAAALWGFGNVAQKTVLDYLDPMSAVGLRCVIGGLLLLPLIFAERHPSGKAYLVSLARVSLPFAFGLVFQQVAYLGTSVTNASFLVNLSTVMTPLFALLLLAEKPSRVVLLSASLALAGAMLLAGGVALVASDGDLAAMAAAAAFALWMVELSRHLARYGNAMTAACIPFFLTAIITLPLGALQGKLTFVAALAAGPELIILGVFSTALAFAILTRAQRFTSSSHAAVIVSAESIFGAIGGAIMLGERVSGLQALGCAVVLAGVLLQAVSGSRSANLKRLPVSATPA